MDKIRYIITGGDNGYCGKCGGLGDRMLLKVNDTKKTYQAYYFFEGCLGGWCWVEQHFDDGMTLVRGKKWQGDFTKMWRGNIYKMWRIENGEVMEEYPVVVKGNKYGKDGEFGDRLDNYKFVGYIEPKEMIEKAQERARELTKNLYARIGEQHDYTK